MTKATSILLSGCGTEDALSPPPPPTIVATQQHPVCQNLLPDPLGLMSVTTALCRKASTGHLLLHHFRRDELRKYDTCSRNLDHMCMRQCVDIHVLYTVSKNDNLQGRRL